MQNCIRRIQSLAGTKLYGKFRIRQELTVKGFERGNILEAFEKVDIDYYENAQKIDFKTAGTDHGTGNGSTGAGKNTR